MRPHDELESLVNQFGDDADKVAWEKIKKLSAAPECPRCDQPMQQSWSCWNKNCSQSVLQLTHSDLLAKNKQ
jgi:hypothetical protein